MGGRAKCWAWCWAFGIFFAVHCASTAVAPSVEHPRAACYLTCTDGRPMRSVIQRQCVAGGRLRGKDILINGEVDNEQNPHASVFLAGKGDERGMYPKDDVVSGTCTMFFAYTRHDIDDKMIGELRGGRDQ